MGDGPYSCTIDDDPCFRSSHGVGLCSSPGLKQLRCSDTNHYCILITTYYYDRNYCMDCRESRYDVLSQIE
jgi:hypothetical protein